MFKEALTLDPEIGGKNNIAHVFEGLACTATAVGKYLRALKLKALVDHLREEISSPRSQTLENYFDRYLDKARRQTVSEDLRRTALEARTMSLDEAVKFALQND